MKLNKELFGRLWQNTLKRIRSPRWWLDVLTDPVVRHAGLFATMMLMLTVVPVAYYFFIKPLVKGWVFDAATQMASEAVVASWCILAVYCLLRRLHKVAGIVWLVVAFLFLTANWLIDLVLALVYKCSFTKDIAGVIAATNPAEGADFIESYGKPGAWKWLFITAAVFIAAAPAAAYAVRLIRRYLAQCVRMWIRIVVLAVLLASLANVIFSEGTLVTQTNLRSKIKIFYDLNLGHEIVPANPAIVHDPASAPQKIMVIIGESLSRSHCSLYGYGKYTEPWLSKLKADSLLWVFERPEAPATGTMAALKRVVGTWNGEDSRNWYECPTFIEIARLSGYRVDWISNQSCKGVYDNPVVKIAEFCDRRKFTSGGMYGMSSMGYDAALIPLVKEWLDDAPSLTVVHLIGNHISYSNRYPSVSRLFKSEDYPELPDGQRDVVSNYDNSVYYNDYVVNELMNLFADHDAVVIYFSDHAQDLYESSPTYYGHGRSDDPVSTRAGKAIPFYVYTSPVYRARHPEMVARIAASVSRPLNTSNLTYALMDIMSTRFAANNDVAEKSFFSVPAPKDTVARLTNNH